MVDGLLAMTKTVSGSFVMQNAPGLKLQRDGVCEVPKKINTLSIKVVLFQTFLHDDVQSQLNKALT